jgi:hypothetical protein
LPRRRLIRGSAMDQCPPRRYRRAVQVPPRTHHIRADLRVHVQRGGERAVKPQVTAMRVQLPLGHDPFVHAWPGWALALTRHHECEGIYAESGRRLRMRDGGAVSSGSGWQ